MKHANLCCMFFLLVFTSHAQFTRGDKALGGFINLNLGNDKGGSLETYTENESKAFSINPSLDVFINKNLSLGGGIGYSWQSQSSLYFYTYPSWSTEIVNESKSIFLKLAAKRYFSLSESFLFSIGSGFSVGKAKYNNTTFDVMTGETIKTKSDDYSASASIAPSFHFFPTRNWSFQAGIGSLTYYFSKNKDRDFDSENVNLHLGQLSFGISYFFRKEVSVQ